MSDDSCYPLDGLPPGEQMMAMAQTLDRLAKVDLVNHWAGETVIHAFSHMTDTIKFGSLYTWSSMLNAQVRVADKKWSDRMILWNRLPCFEEIKQAADAYPEQEFQDAIRDAMTFMNYAGEDDTPSATSMMIARYNQYDGEHDSPEWWGWWLSLLMGIAHCASHVDERERSTMRLAVSEYPTHHPYPTSFVVSLKED
ncbi:hypothetical protein PQD13_gp17 [Gordonia phage Clawz]|uniref:Uncharacterized protein n=1 Tax=Gordonia phage Clawz TaxID=2743910 RepID=A0AAE7K683_9CAUD|nr:hypothetical protein PQD13_gp17 [Gordonia phage Clawz]QKY79929.1 hypothetical protein SEA_CLAWZ_17 [Gordonia phage Clawz]